MTTINLFRPERYSGSLGIEREEAERILTAYKKGEELFYEEGEGTILIDQEGTMHIKGFKEICGVFDAFEKEDDVYVCFDMDATYNKDVKALIKKVIFYEGTEWIANTCKHCVNLEEAIVPGSVRAIHNAFAGCNKLSYYDLPEGLEQISGQIFGIYPEKITLPDGIDNIDSVFSNTKIKSITLPKSLKRIGYRGLAYCSELEELIFKEGIESLSSEALTENKKLNHVVLPRSLDYIGSYAFSGCSSLTDIVFLGDSYAESSAFDRAPCNERVRKLLFNQRETIEYDGSTDKIKDYEKLVELQEGKTLAEQAELFIVIKSSYQSSLSYGELDKERYNGNEYSLFNSNSVEKLILKNGIIVGIVVKGHTILVGQSICTYFAIDEDGTGREEVEEYHTFLAKY